MNQPTLSPEAEVLLKLLRIAIGTEQDLSFPANLNWQEVMHLAERQKVLALAFDGLTQSGYQIPDNKLLDYWSNEVAKSEQSYAYYKNVLNTFCQIFISNGLTPIILKGYGLGLNYPIPSHRGLGDIDVFLIDKNGKPSAYKGDEIARNILNLSVVRHGKEHHSSFAFKGILVENHYELRGEFFKTEAEKQFLEQLKVLIVQDKQQASEIEGAYFPSATFNAVFLMRHMIGNLHHGLLNLRQITDWVTFWKAHNQEIDWNQVNKTLSDAELFRFSQDINNYIEKQFGFAISNITHVNINDRTINEISKAIFNPLKHGHTAIDRITYYYRNRWMTKYFFNQSWIVPIIRSFIQYL